MKTYLARSLNQLASKLVVEILSSSGIKQFFISPGSRSTPLTSAIADATKSAKLVHFDERGSAFAALGYARATNKPAVLVCTSGTALANYMPAVVEASNDRIPMIILSADRPPELQGVNANQTIDQQDIYGSYPRCFINIEPPKESKEYFSNLRSSIKDAIAQSSANPAGPIHINFMFREPLVPLDDEKDYSHLIDQSKNSKQANVDAFDLEKISFVLNKLKNRSNVLLVAGYQKDHTYNDTILKLAENCKFPIFADVRSRLRIDHPNVITHFDQLLLSDNFNLEDNLNVIHIGGNLVSKRYLEFIERSAVENYIHIDSESYTYNPHHKQTDSICAPLDNVFRQLETSLEKTDEKVLSKLQQANSLVKKMFSDHLDNDQSLSEPIVARTISQSLKDNNVLFLGSSMPVRDYDMYADPVGVQFSLIANRGASGIDGSIATACGFAMGHVKKGVALIGDLAFLHDLNSLSLVEKTKQPMLIIIINNDGGGIFSFLPIAKCENIFEPYFGTPHGYSFESAAKLFKLEYQKINTITELSEAIIEFNNSSVSKVIELETNRAENLKFHKSLSELITNKIENL